MAKQSSTDKFKALVGLEFTGAEEGIKKLESQMKPLGSVLPKELSKGFADNLKDIEKLKKALKEAGDEKTLRGLEESMAHVLDSAIKTGEALSKSLGKRGQIVNVGATNAQVNALKRLRDGLKQVNIAGTRTTLMSQNMLRVIQDSPFGMLGMANNIQMLAENLSHARAQGQSFTQAMGAGLRNLIMGPMSFAALIAVGTIVIQKWDEISNAASILMEKLDGLSEAQRKLNERVRNFKTNEWWDKYIESLKDEDLPKQAKQLREELDRLRQLMNEAGIVDRKVTQRRAGVFSIVSKALGLGTVGEVFESDIHLVRQYEETLNALNKINERVADKNETDAVKRQAGIETDADKEAEREIKRRQKAQIARLKAIDEHRAAIRKMYEDVAELARKADEQRIKDAAKAAKAEVAARMKAMREESQRIRREAAAISKGVSAGDIQARGIGAGTVPLVFGDSSTEDQIASARASLFNETLIRDEKIAIRREAMRKLDILMQQAHGAELKNLKAQKARLMAQEEDFKAQIVQLTHETEHKIEQIKKAARIRDLNHMQQIAGSMGQTFGNMATMFASESEKGLKQHRGLLKLAAFADAIAAGVAVYRNIAQAGKANPLVMIGAAAAMAATITGLIVKIKQIDNPSGLTGGGGGGAPSGGFVALNQNIAANRAADFAQDQKRLDRVSKATGVKQADEMRETMHFLAERIQDQKVIVDPQGIQDITREGAKNVNRRVQTTG